MQTLRERGWVRPALALTGVAALVAGCGSSTPSTTSLRAILPAAYTSTINAGSAQLTLAVTVTTEGQHISVSGSGGFDWADKQGQLTEQTTVPGAGAVSLTEILDGTNIYVSIPASARSALGGKSWLEVSLAQFEGSQKGGIDPAQTLALLEAHSTSVTKVGTQTIDGVATTHYRALVNPAQASKGLGPAAQKLLAQLPALTGSATLPIDVWIDSAGRPRQMQYSATLQHPPAGSPASASNAFPETTAFTIGFSDYGQPVSVTVPPPDQVSTQSLSSLTGGAVGS